MIETLESRALLSATFPTLVGSYSGTYAYSSGDTGTVSLNVYGQARGLFLAIATQSNGLTAVVRGRVSPAGALRFNVKPNAFRQHGHGAGTFSNGAFNATEVIKGPGVNISSTITLTKN